MSPDAHARIADRIGASMARCDDAEFELVIEAAMLAGAHWLNAALHAARLTDVDEDVLHSEFLTLGERRRIAIIVPGLIEGLDEIEEMRAPFVRGAEPDGDVAGARARVLLEQIRSAARGAMSAG